MPHRHRTCGLHGSLQRGMAGMVYKMRAMQGSALQGLKSQG
jgi:hypothetical protein